MYSLLSCQNLAGDGRSRAKVLLARDQRRITAAAPSNGSINQSITILVAFFI
jgi:hypothetical protein